MDTVLFFSSASANAIAPVSSDPTTLAIMWDSSVGDGSLLRGLGLALAIFAITSRIKFKYLGSSRYFLGRNGE